MPEIEPDSSIHNKSQLNFILNFQKWSRTAFGL